MSLPSPNARVYDFEFKSADAQSLKLSQFKDCVILIVNTASGCIFTKQYTELEQLYEKYRNQGLVIMGVPSNDFMGQEPGTNAEIQQFCRVNFKTTFIIAQKEHIKGPDAHPFYVFARKRLGFWTAPKWNFHKYLINRQGQLVDYFHSPVSPHNSRLIKAIEKLLNQPKPMNQR